MFALEPLPFDLPIAAPVRKQLVHRLPFPPDHCFPDRSNFPFLSRNPPRELVERTETPLYILQEQVEFCETDQFTMPSFPQDLEFQIPAIFDSIPCETPNSLPRSTAAEISWLRRDDGPDFLKDDFERESYSAPSNAVENDFYMGGSERSFRSDPNRHVKREVSQPDRARVRDTIQGIAPKLHKAFTGGMEEEIFPKLCIKLKSSSKSPWHKAERSNYTLKVKREKYSPPAVRKPMKCTIPTLDGYRKVHTKHTPGKKPKLKARWTLMCAHCGKIFCARPTPKNSRYVVNHMCPMHGNKRKQFVIGTKTRRCEKTHHGPCIQQLVRRID